MASRSVDTELWSDSKITDEFTPEDKYFWLFLLTTRYGNLSGVFEITPQQIARDMGYSKESVENLIFRFETQHKLISYNKDTKELFIYNWYKYNWTRSPLFEKSLFKYIDKIKNEDFKQIVSQMYQDYKESNTVLIPYRYPTKSNTVSNTNSISTISLDLDLKEETYTIEELFNDFWENYPRKVSKGQAEITFYKLKPNKELVDTMILKLQKLVKHNWAKRDKDKIPHASTWLNAKGWLDEIEQSAEEKKMSALERFMNND